MSSGQRVVVYNDPATQQPKVYTTWYTMDQMRRAIVACGRRHGRASKPRTRVG